MKENLDPSEETNTYEESTLDNIHHVNNPVLDLPQIEKKYLDEIKSYSQSDSTYYFYDGVAKVEVKVVTDEIIRVRLAPQGTFLEDFSYAIAKKNHRISRHQCIEEEDAYLVKNQYGNM